MSGLPAEREPRRLSEGRGYVGDSSPNGGGMSGFPAGTGHVSIFIFDGGMSERVRKRRGHVRLRVIRSGEEVFP